MNGPDPVADLLEADGMLLQGVGEEEELLLQANGARVGDALDEEVAGILSVVYRHGDCDSQIPTA